VSTPSVLVHRDAGLLAKAVAARLIVGLVDAQAAKGSAHVVLTGGGAGIATLAEVAATAAHAAVEWPRLDVWWGDERFLPTRRPARRHSSTLMPRPRMMIGVLSAR
jgi:6-phosphogluconolactonase